MDAQRYFLLFTLWLIHCVVCAQRVSVEYLLEEPQQRIEKFAEDKNGNNVVIKMDFASDEIKSPFILNITKDKSIELIQLVYTDYRESTTFGQPALNGKRLEALLLHAPWLFNNTAIQWKFIAQTGCKNPESCKEFFHGFVIKYKSLPTEETQKKEIDFIENVLKHSKTRDSVTVVTYKNSASMPASMYITKAFNYLPRSKKKRDKGIFYVKERVWKMKKRAVKNKYAYSLGEPEKAKGFFRRDMIIQYDSIPGKAFNKGKKSPLKKYSYTYLPDTADTYRPTSLEKFFAHYPTFTNIPFSDTVLSAVMNRNKSWKNIIVAADVTGSMCPYIAQMLVWIALAHNSENVKQYFFFNDGNLQPDASKKTGKTGGIYSVGAKEIDNVIKKITEAMLNGNGGDAPENDIEALLAAIDKSDDGDEIILIADNNANMRDFELIHKIKKPVRVIVCGSFLGINTEYLELAKNSGGSIHTLEEDLFNLKELNEGETIKIGLQKFVISRGKFVLTH